MSIGLLLVIFVVVAVLSLYLLATGGVLADFRRRPLSEMARSDGSEILANAPARWIENHEFWELSATSGTEGAFWDDETDADTAAEAPLAEEGGPRPGDSSGFAVGQ